MASFSELPIEPKYKKGDMVQTREAYGNTLVELGKLDSRIVVLDADLAESTLTRYFRDNPDTKDRFIECGIAEQNMICIAAGLSTMGFIPFLSSYAQFLASRALDQARNTVDYTNMNVKIAAAHGGISVGKDGPSHQSMEDISNMSALVNMSVVVPGDYYETIKVVRWAADYIGPVYFRLGREKLPVVTNPGDKWAIGKSQVLRDGADGTIIACGYMLHIALDAADILANEGIKARVINMASIKPIDTEAILKAASETGAITTTEEHSVYGGLGSIVARVVVESDYRVPMRIVGIPNKYLTSAPAEELCVMAGLTKENIATKHIEALKSANKSIISAP
jgi:transketolase